MRAFQSLMKSSRVELQVSMFVVVPDSWLMTARQTRAVLEPLVKTGRPAPNRVQQLQDRLTMKGDARRQQMPSTVTSRVD